MEPACKEAIRRNWQALVIALENHMTTQALGKYVTHTVLTIKQRKHILKAPVSQDEKVGILLRYLMEKKGSFDILLDSLSDNKQNVSGLALILQRSRQNVQKAMQKASVSARGTITVSRDVRDKLDVELGGFESMLELTPRGNEKNETVDGKMEVLERYRTMLETLLSSDGARAMEDIDKPSWFRKTEKTKAQLDMKMEVVSVLRNEIVEYKDKKHEQEDEIEILKRQLANKDVVINEQVQRYTKLQERHRKSLRLPPGSEMCESAPSSRKGSACSRCRCHAQINNFIDNRTYNINETVVTGNDNVQVGIDGEMKQIVSNNDDIATKEIYDDIPSKIFGDSKLI